MSAIELKSRIIDRIASIQDETVLQDIYNLIKIESEIEAVYKFTDIEKKR